MKINIINKSQHALPNYETIASAWNGFKSKSTESVTLAFRAKQSLKLDFYQLPIGYEAQVRPRSGLAFKME
jgi:dUTP pyrophosphatase